MGEGLVEVAQGRRGVGVGAGAGVGEGGAEERQLVQRTVGTSLRQGMMTMPVSLETLPRGISSWTETWFSMNQLPMHRPPEGRNPISSIYPISRSSSASRGNWTLQINIPRCRARSNMLLFARNGERSCSSKSGSWPPLECVLMRMYNSPMLPY